MARARLSRIGDLAEKLLPTLSDAPQHLQVQEDLRALQRMLHRIQAVLNDAEKRWFFKDESVRLWLSELKGVAYDAEDVLDEFDYELLRAKVEGGTLADEAAFLPCQRKSKRGKFEEISRSHTTEVNTSLSLSISLCADVEGKFEEISRSHTTEVDTSLSLSISRTGGQSSRSASMSISSVQPFWDNIANSMREIRGRFEEISKDRDALHLREGDGEGQFQMNPVERPPSSHIVDTPTISGRKDDLEEVINKLLKPDGCKKSNPSVLPIVGMGGVGKTTFVQHVYNDQRVCDHFQMKGWVCVSDDFRVENLTAKIIESLTGGECKLQEFSALQQKLKEVLDGKHFLLVLDDVWNENFTLWESLQKPFRFGKEGSAVITTTRSERVARMMQTMPFHCLNCLSSEDCWVVFKQSACFDPNQDMHLDLIEIGEKIVKKCSGLPLAAKSLGGLLRNCVDANKWEDVLESDAWDIGDQGDGILPALRLSYLHLPSYLKPCFLYTSLFPKDFRFDKSDLIRQWMAQGLITSTGSKLEAEQIGSNYFEELVDVSFFQPYFCNQWDLEDEDVLFVMHDLIHDVALRISEGEFFCMQGQKTHVLDRSKVRHLSIATSYMFVKHDLIHDVAQSMSEGEFFCVQLQGAHLLSDRQVRELSLLATSNMISCSAPPSIRTLAFVRWTRIDDGLLLQMIQSLRFLRVLDLSQLNINMLPDSIGDLKLLRYLNVDGNYEIKRLPGSICKLYNLQTLSLQHCRKPICLPGEVESLVNLRCLRTVGSTFIWKGIAKLTSLHTLDVFRVGWLTCEDYKEEYYRGIEELKELIHLTGRIEITNLRWVMNAENANAADLRNKRNITELSLVWQELGEYLPREPASPDVQAEVLENLRPPDRLEALELDLDGYRGVNLPRWMMSTDEISSFSKLVKVELTDCKCARLPPLGQLASLKQLLISGTDMVDVVGAEFCGPHTSTGFPALEELKFRLMKKCVRWVVAAGRGDFPCLRRLTVSFCNILESMAPLYLLPALEELEIAVCPKLKSIELWSSAASSGSPASSTSQGPPSIRRMEIINCPQARLSWEDNELELPPPPPLLEDLDIGDCEQLVEWCEGRGASWLARIPNAKVWRTRGPYRFIKMVSTSVPSEDGILRKHGYVYE